MGDIQLCLLLLLSSYALAQQNDNVDDQTPTCLLATRFRAFKKHVYQYTTESRNGVTGTANLRNGPKVTCQVEIEVPQTCSFVLHTRDCALSEVSVMDPQGQPVYRQATGAEAFQAAMEKNPLKFTVKQLTEVNLFPEPDEPINIVNIKRGIISALMVPVVEEENNSYMNTVHGLCKSTFTVNARKDIATDVTVSRDLSECDHFKSRSLPHSPLALIQAWNGPITRLISSSQECNYQFDNRRKHMTTAECTEKHIYLPFSHENNGISSVVTQTLTLQDSAKINNRNFEVDLRHSKPLHMEEPEDKAPVQTKDAALSTLQDLKGLSNTDQGHTRARLFHKLVSGLRTLKNETLSQTVEEMMEVSGILSWQALAQCGTPECTSAILQASRAVGGMALEVDAFVYAVGLQSSPDSHRVRDMLSIAEYKQSKAIMYALANTVRKFHDGQITPQVAEVSRFMTYMLGDCLQDEDMTFLTLRVIGVMGKAMQDVNPSIKSSLLNCVRQSAAFFSVQKAAIQAFRLMVIDEEVKNTLLEVYQGAGSPVQKRVTAYLMLMKSPDQALVTEVVNTLKSEQEPQLRSFVASHLDNIIRSGDPKIQQTRQYIEEAFTHHALQASIGSFIMSRSYKIDNILASTQGNVIFDSNESMPKEVMLETTLKAFGFNVDILEVGIEGNGFQSSLEALFGENGFFPDSASKAIYWAGDEVPGSLKKVLENWLAPLQDERMKRQAPQDLLHDLGENVQKLVGDLRSQDSPEAMAYLRILGNELGYIKSSEMQEIVRTLSMYYNVFFKVLPAKAMNALLSGTENELYAHYIFLENAFSLPSASGLPLKFSLTGVFAPGAKGGLNFSPGMQHLSFMPSVGVEFITHMGIHIPEFVVAGIEMHTNMYHESALNSKVTISRNQVKLSIPAPKGNTQLFSVSNKLLSVASQTKIVPSMVEDRADSTECQPLFTGLKYCTILRYSNASSTNDAPYYPLTGETRFAVEIQPTGEVSEYTAAIAFESIKEGENEHQKVDTLKLILQTEGAEATEATATIKYNRNTNTLDSELKVPDFDIEAGIKLAVTDSNVKGKKMRGITVDVTNKNIPQLTLIGHARLESMKDGMLQIEMTIPSLSTDASATVLLKNTEGLVMQFNTAINIPVTTSLQNVIVKYDNSKFEVEMMSDIKSEIQKLIPNTDNYQRQLQELLDDILDQRVAKTDMKLRHIVSKAIEAINIWLNRFGVSNIENLRNKRNIAELTIPKIPEMLFLQCDSSFRYQFNQNKMAISLPVLLGGTSSKDLNIPSTLSIPLISMPVIGIQIPANEYRIPSFTIPPSIDFKLPLIGLGEVSTKIKSNFYNWEGSISGGNSTVDVPSYIAQYTVMAQSPVNPLSYKLEGTGMISGTVEDNLKYLVNGSFSHSFFDASFSVIETLSVTDKVNARANYRIEASSPLGLHTSLYYSAKSASAAEEVTGDGTLDGSICVGSFVTNSTYSHNYAIRPLDREGRGESNLRVNSPLIQAHNMIKGVYVNSELSIVSKTNVQNDAIKHVAELKYKNAQLTLKCDAASNAFDKTLRHKVEIGLSSDVAILRVEAQADDATNRAYSLITGTLNSDGLEINSEGSITFTGGRGLHKASATANNNGLLTSSTTTLQCSPITFETIFNGGVDSSGASLSILSKGMAEESRGELKVEGLISATAASLNSVFKGIAPDANVRNTVDFLLNRQALKLSNNMMGSLKTMKTENTHTITLTLWTLALRSKMDNYICDDASYKHDINIDMKPFVTSMNMKNDLKLFDVSLNNEGRVKLETCKLDLTGSLRGAYGEDHELKHTYEINYADLTGSFKCSTTGHLLDAQISQNCEIEFAGLASKSNCEARINSKSLHFDSTVRTMALPFSLTVDAMINSDGEINLYGDHTGQLYSKLLVKAEPLGLAYSHNCRASTTHLFEGSEHTTNLDNNVDGVVTPIVQSLTWKTKSKLNNHAYSQDIYTYNNPEKVGLECSGVMSTDLFSQVRKDRERRSEKGYPEFSITGFLKYDKNSDLHFIELPFIESLPVAFDRFKTTIVNALESLNHYIQSLNIDQLLRDFRANLEQLPQQVGDFMKEFDLENKVEEIKRTLNYLTQEYAITIDDLEASVENLRINLEQTLANIATQLASFREYIKNGDLSATISKVLSQIGDRFRAFDEHYEIRQTIVRAIDAVDDIIRQMDLRKIQDSSVAWFQDLDAKFGILAKLQETLAELKQVIDTFDVSMFFQDLNDYILSINLAKFVDWLTAKLSSEEMNKVLESAKDVIVNWIEEYTIEQKINAVYAYVRDLLLKYNVDETIGDLMKQIVVLVRDFRIEQTVQSIVNNFRSVYLEVFYDKCMELLDGVTQQFKAIDFKQSIDELNQYISSQMKAIKAFDYNLFVDDANQRIIEITNYINGRIKEYEIPQKIEAFREFVREIQVSIFNYLEELKNTKVAEMFLMLKDLIDTTAYNDIKMKAVEILEDMRQRVIDMDIREEIFVYLRRASESYSNMLAYISVQFNKVVTEVHKVLKDQEIVTQISQAVDGILNALKSAKITIPSFVTPVTDLVIPTFEINLNSLQDISIPAQISVPEFTIFSAYTVPAFTIDFEEIKAKLIALIDLIREIEIPMPDPEKIFGDLKALYMPDLPDLTFPEIIILEIKFPTMNIPKLNLENFEITMLPIPEIKLPQVPSEVKIPAFGKLYSELRLNSPYYTLMTAAALENSTVTSKTPQFTATLTSQAKSTIEILDYSLDAIARLEAPKMKKLVFTESIKATHMAFTIDHEGSLTLSGPSAEASAKTIAKVTTEMYTADVVNNFAFVLRSGISVSMDTNYNHNLNIPTAETSSQATMTQIVLASLESGTIFVTVGNNGSGKWSIHDYSDEGTHKSNLEFNINFGTAKVTFNGETNSNTVNMKQILTAESIIFSHITVEGRAETELPFIRSSVMILNGEANVGDLKMEVTASHNAELIGRISGTVSNSLEFLVRPFEIVLDFKNKAHSKTIFPLKLTGKVDLQHDYGVVLNSEVQRVCWVGLARFNQYKYNHNITLDHNHKDISIYATMNGEANLEFLTVPLTMPEMTVPYLGLKTPDIKELSLWEDVGLKNLLTTPRQSYDMNLKLQYKKNPDMQAVDFDLEPVYDAINENADAIRAHFELGRDKTVALLTNSYNKAKKQLDKYKIHTSKNPPRIFTVPGYKIPILNIEVSAFRAELPAFSFVIPKEVSTPSFKVPTMGFSVPSYTLVLPFLELPVLHVPETLSELTLPSFTLPDIKNNVMVPAMGNLTCDFSFKSTVITMTSNAGLYNQSDIVAKFGMSLTSIFDILNGKMDGTTSLTQKRGTKLATALTLEHKYIEGSQDSTISLSKRGIEASLANVVKVNLPFMTLELNQELLGNTMAKPNFASKIKLKHMFNIPLIKAVGKGLIDQNLVLEGLSSYISLETTTKGMTDITVMDSLNVAGDIDNEANFYLNINGLRTTVKTDLSSNINHKTAAVLSLDINKNLALEASLRRMYATLNYTSNNNVNIAAFNSNGKHFAKATLDFVPLTTLTVQVEVDISQPCNFGDAGLIQNIDLTITSEKQTFSWSGKEHLAAVIHTCELQLSNDETEIRMEVTGSFEAHLAFLKSVKLPVYQKTIWDILKFDQFTSIDMVQFLNVSSAVVYSKNMNGLEFAIPAKLFDNGVIFSVPEFTLSVPTWIKEIPQTVRKIDMRYENVDLPDQVSVPPVITFPAFDVPFTTLHVPAFTMDTKTLEIPKVITTTAFDVMIPFLPKMEVPSFDINTEYIQNKMSFLSVKLPQYDITISSFTFPKSFTDAEHIIHLGEIANYIANFEIPTITIPEQKMEIPEIALHLPASVFIPVFGSLYTTVKVSSPIYNVTSTAQLENKDSSMVTSLKSTCTSTMIFAEYDLDATATLHFENGVISLNGKCNFLHSDVNIDWQHVFAQNLRMKRQASPDAVVSRHTLNVDLTSPTFVDVSFRYASRKDGITASVSSPSSGFLGFLLQRRSPSQVYGKLFSRYLSTPDKDMDILSVKATLRNSEKLNLQTAWNLDGLHHMIEGSKERMPAITEALLKFVNKYHTAHFGYDVNRAFMKFKNSVSNVIERVYHEVPMTFDTINNSIKQLSDQSREMYRKAADNIPTINMGELKDSFVNSAMQVIQHSEQNFKIMLDAVMKFVSETKFSLPGFEMKLTGQEIYQRISQSVTMTTETVVQKCSNLMEAIADTIESYIRGIEFTVPGSNLVVSGTLILEKVRSAMSAIQDHIIQSVRYWENVSLDSLFQKVNDLLQLCLQKSKEVIASLRAENLEIMSHFDSIYAEVLNTLQSAENQLQEFRESAAECKDLAKMKVQEVYNAMTMERVNNDLTYLISVFQSQFFGWINGVIDFMRQATQNTTPYLKVSSKKMDIEVPLPFFWKSFNEWPVQIRQ